MAVADAGEAAGGEAKGDEHEGDDDERGEEGEEEAAEEGARAARRRVGGARAVVRPEVKVPHDTCSGVGAVVSGEDAGLWRETALAPTTIQPTMNPRQNHVAVNASSLVAFHATARDADAYTDATSSVANTRANARLPEMKARTRVWSRRRIARRKATLPRR